MNALDRLLIEQDCLKLMHAYCVFLDDGDHEGFLSLFTPDAIWLQTSEPVTELRGHKGISRFLAHRPTDRLYRHMVQNPIITVNGPDEAHGFCIGLVVDGPNRPGQSPVPIFGVELVAEYRDTYRRDATGWHITRREMTRILDRKAEPVSNPDPAT